MNAKRMMMTMAAAAALAFAGCVPGTAKIMVKASELDKAMDGGIGWVKVVEHQEKEYDNIALTNVPENVLSKFKLEPTNRYEHVVACLFKGFDYWIPLFLQDDEKVTYGYAVTNGKVRAWLDAELVVPIGRHNALLKAQLPRLMQLEIEDDRDVVAWVRSDEMMSGREARKFLGAPAAMLGCLEKDTRFSKENDVEDFFWCLNALTDPFEMENTTFEMLPGKGRHKLIATETKYGPKSACFTVAPVN